jgi:ubiquinone/menaquinone biosynthesis C-methylase UbiE
MIEPLIRVLKHIARWLTLLFAGFLLWQVLARLLRRLVPLPAPPIVGRLLDSDVRRRLQPPEHVIQRGGIRPGMRVLELGCGSGAYTTLVARAVGPTGWLYALDLQAGMLRQLVAKLRRPEHADLANVSLIRGNAHHLPFATGSLDLVYMVTVLPEVPDGLQALREVRRVLKPGGTLAVVEFLPDPDYPLPSTTVRMGEAVGLVSEGVAGNLWSYTARFIAPL